MTAVGVAKPKLHGHATRQTSTARRAPRPHADPPPRASVTAGYVVAAAAAAVGAVKPKRDGDKAPQNNRVEADAAKTIQVNRPAMVSASRCTGTLRAYVVRRAMFINVIVTVGFRNRSNLWLLRLIGG